MKKSVRLTISGSLQPMFFNSFVKDNADKLGVRGFIRTMEDKRMEIFLEGNIDVVEKMIPLCKRGPEHSMIRNVEVKEERFQDFKDFRVLRI